MKYVCLEGLEEGNRFYTSAGTSREDDERLADGTVAYKVLGYADTDVDARKILYGPDCDTPLNRAVRMRAYLSRIPGMDISGLTQLAVLLSLPEERK